MLAAELTRERGGPWTTPPSGVRILIVDDDSGTREALAALVAHEGYETRTANDGDSALAVAKWWAPDVVVTDLMMPNMDGIELCRRLHDVDSDLPVIITTAAEQSDAGLACLRAGAEDYLSKPVQVAAVVWCVQRALERRASTREQAQLRAHADELCERLRTVNEHLIVSSIHERERAEAEAQRRAELNALLQGLSEGIIVVDVSGHVRMINDAACAILGLGRKPAGMDALQALELRDLHGRRLRDEERPLHRALQGHHFAGHEMFYVLPDGQQRCLTMTGTHVKHAGGGVAVAIVVFRDVTDLRRLEQQREEYAALISHDLRNPLNVVLMSAQLLKEYLTEKQLTNGVEHIGRIERNSRRMAAMLEELTEATSLESNGTDLQRTPCDLGKLVGDIVGELDEPRARRVTIDAGDAGPYLVFADAARLERCISNLLTNALKYSGADAPAQVRLSRTASHVELDVIDRGIGIAPENVKQIFDRYYRTMAGKGRAEGLGLGLYITRLIVEAHGGRIDVLSEVGTGSTFRLILPVHAVQS